MLLARCEEALGNSAMLCLIRAKLSPLSKSCAAKFNDVILARKDYVFSQGTELLKPAARISVLFSCPILKQLDLKGIPARNNMCFLEVT